MMQLTSRIVVLFLLAWVSTTSPAYTQGLHGYCVGLCEPDNVQHKLPSRLQTNWVLAVNRDWIDDNTYRGGYLAARGLADERLYIELGVLVQRLPRKDSQRPDKTRYFMAFRVGLDTLVSPYFSVGIDPVQLMIDQWLYDYDEENSRANLHSQLGLSLKPTDFFRVDLFGTFIRIDKHKSFNEVNSQSLSSAGIRLNLLF